MSFVHQTSTFDSPKKEKRLQRKWRHKNYNKDVKTTLQVNQINTNIKVQSCLDHFSWVFFQTPVLLASTTGTQLHLLRLDPPACLQPQSVHRSTWQRENWLRIPGFTFWCGKAAGGLLSSRHQLWVKAALFISQFEEMLEADAVRGDL